MRGKGVWAILSALALLALSSELGAVWEFRLPELQAVPGQQNLAVPVYGTTENSMAAFQFQIAFCEDEDSMKIWVDSITLHGNSDYITLFDTLSQGHWYANFIITYARSVITGGAMDFTSQGTDGPLDNQVLVLVWVHIEPTVAAPDTIELDLTEDMPCPPNFHTNCIYSDQEGYTHHADLVDGAIYVVPSPIHITVDPPGPYSVDEGAELTPTVTGTSEEPNDELQLQVLGGLEPWMDFSPGPPGNPTSASLTLHPGYCDDGTYVVELGLSSTAYDITIMRPETIEVSNANRRPVRGRVRPAEQTAPINGLRPIEVSFYDSDMECHSPHAADSLRLSFEIEPEPEVMPDFEDYGDGYGRLSWLSWLAPGNYTLTFTAVDDSGESCEVQAFVRVLPAFMMVPVSLEGPDGSGIARVGLYMRSFSELKGLYLEVRQEGVMVEPGDYVPDFRVRWEDPGGVLRVWVWRESGEPIPPGEGVILTLDGGDVELLKVEELENVFFERYDEIEIRPNPSEGAVTISYSLARSDEVEVSVYDATGKFVRRLVSSEVDAGRHATVWDGRDYRRGDVRSGLYFIEFKTGNRTFIRKLIMLR
ncbi:MAG: T9SS type A sorting domain-containing protein [Candidatus Hydrothermae bacterium]|nr:T9SS type A sorting domain-containing protein [Candidatus Hydrothermae bacterium]